MTVYTNPVYKYSRRGLMKNLLAMMSCVMLLAACGGGGGNTVSAPATGDSPSVAAKQVSLAVGDVNCPNGGIVCQGFRENAVNVAL